MDNHDNSTHSQSHDHQVVSSDEAAEGVTTRIIEGDTYPISDNESNTDSVYIIDTNTVKLPHGDADDDEQGEELDESMSQDSLTNGEHDDAQQNPSTKHERPSSTNLQSNSRMSSKMSTMKSSMNGFRSLALDEHIKLVKQKKEEAEVLRLQRFQEQLRKKEQKWQQQQLERVKKWLQLRNRDTDHRSQVEERRKKREEEAKAKIDELIRREKEREQHYQQRATQHLKTNSTHKPEAVMSMSTDVLSSRRAISASRLRSNPPDPAHRRGFNHSPVRPTSSESADTASVPISSFQLNSIDEQQAPLLNDTTDESSWSGAAQSSSARTVPTSFAFWLNTGDVTSNPNANFMRSTYAATCRAHLSRSITRCPRACRARDDACNTAPTATSNGDSHRRIQSVNRAQMNETVRRLTKPRQNIMTQSIHIGATASASRSLPLSRSSHQLRVPTPPVNSTPMPGATSSNARRHVPSRPATVPASTSESRTSPADGSDHPPPPSSSSTLRQPPAASGTTRPKVPSAAAKPPTASNSARSKSSAPRSVMTTSHSSSSLSSATTTTTNKSNLRRIGGVLPSKAKPVTSIATHESELISTGPAEETVPVNDESKHEEEPVVETVEATPSLEPIPIDTIIELINPPAASATKREQQLLDEQEYQRKLGQKIREAQQRLEMERQREEERQRQLELEEFEREQEQIRLVEEQRRAEQERLQRAINERDRENEFKRQEEQRLQQQREELERRQTEETERLQRERQERAKKEEDERNERKKRLDLIMRRTRQISPTSKQDNNNNKTMADQTNGHDQTSTPTHIYSPTSTIKSSITHSMSENRFPSSTSTDDFLLRHEPVASPTTAAPTDTPKFKSPLIQSLLNKARNTRSTDNLAQSSMTASQIMTESMIDESTIGSAAPAQSLTPNDLSDDDETNTTATNGHSDLHLSSSNNMNSYHDRPMETAAAFQ